MTMSGNCEVKFFNISSGGVLLISGGSTAAIRVLAGGQINGFTRSEDEYRADGFTHGVIHSNTYVQHRTTATLYNSTTSAVGTEIRYTIPPEETIIPREASPPCWEMVSRPPLFTGSARFLRRNH